MHERGHAGEACAMRSCRWCVNVALQSFCGEPWALMCGERFLSPRPSNIDKSRETSGRNSPEAPASSDELCDKSGKKSSHTCTDEARPSQVLMLCSSEASLCALNLRGDCNSSAEMQGLQHCLRSIQSCRDNGALMDHVVNVEFTSLPTETDRDKVDGLIDCTRYTLRKPITNLITATLNPAVSAVVDECINAVVLVYGATHEMIKLGVIGTPDECCLFPKGICMLMDRCAKMHERREDQTNQKSFSLPCRPQAPTHRFVRAECTFIALHSDNILDLINLNNDKVKLGVQLGESPRAQPHCGHEERSGASGVYTNVVDGDFVCHAHTVPTECASDALEALALGLKNFSIAKEMGLLQSELGTSLLFSIVLFTEDCHSATFHLMCVAEDTVLQNWLVSSARIISQSIPSDVEPDWSTFQKIAVPTPLNHHAAALLVPSLSFGNVFTSALVCAYNSMFEVPRLTRDLTFATSGYRMITVPQVTPISSHRVSKSLLNGWTKGFTHDGWQCYIEKMKGHTVRKAPRAIEGKKSPKCVPSVSTNVKVQMECIRIPLSKNDREHLCEKLRKCSVGSFSEINPLICKSNTVVAASPYTIVVVDTNNERRVVLGPEKKGGTTLAECTSYNEEKMTQMLVNNSLTTPNDDAGKKETDCNGPEREATVEENTEHPLKRQKSMYNMEDLPTASMQCGENVHGSGGDEHDKDVKVVNALAQDETDSLSNTRKFYTNVVLGTQEKSESTSVMNQDTSEASTQKSPEMQELESLVDEFSRFYREAYVTKKRVKYLEDELAQTKAMLHQQQHQEKTSEETFRIAHGFGHQTADLKGTGDFNTQENILNSTDTSAHLSASVPDNFSAQISRSNNSFTECQFHRQLLCRLRDALQSRGNESLVQCVSPMLEEEELNKVDTENGLQFFVNLWERVLDHGREQDALIAKKT